MAAIEKTIVLSNDVELFFGAPGAPVDFILMESGSALLLENNDEFLME